MIRKITEQDLTAVTVTVHHGYTIERTRVKGGSFSDSDHYGIALGKDERGRCVTWQFHFDDEELSLYWGHYAENPDTAVQDYETRE